MKGQKDGLLIQVTAS